MFSKLNLSCFIILISFFPGISVFAQTGFEGKIALRITGDESADIDYFIKDSNIRMEMDAEGNKAVIIFNHEDHKTKMLMPEQNMYMEFDANQYMVNNNNMKNDKEADDIERTGEFEKINGYKCEKWIFKDEDNLVTAWMTGELGNFYMMMNPMDKSSQDKWKQRLQGNYFPMKVTVTEDDETTSTMEVLSVDKMSLKEDLFNVPSGYQKFNMPNMDMFK
jgi:hypothetical protein